MVAALLLTSCGNAENGTKENAPDMSGDFRLIMKVADVTATTDDDLIAVPVYLSHSLDTLAGVETHFRIENNRSVYFATDEKRADSLQVAADTAGSIISGWEWIGVNSLDSGLYDLHLVALADWPNDVVTPASLPAEKATLVTLYLRQDKNHPIEEKVRIEIVVNADKTSFAQPTGKTIGLVTSIEKRCSEYDGDTCVAWKRVKVGKRDTTAVSFRGGSVTIIPKD